MFDSIKNLFRSPPKQRTSGLGAGLSDQDDHRFPTFQTAWKQGATFEDMFGDQPFQLHGSVGGSGADNHRPDVAKVETFLGDAGFYKPMTNDGPTGWHNTNLDTAIKGFQKANGLKVDGLLKPNGPTITKIGGLLGGGQDPTPAPSSKFISDEDAKRLAEVLNGGDNPQPQKPPSEPRGTPPRPPVGWPTGGPVFDPPTTFPMPAGSGTGHPKPPGTGPDRLPPREPVKGVDYIEMNGWNPHAPPIRVPLPRAGSAPDPRDPFPGHDIDEEGAAEHDRYAQALVDDSDPSKTAAFLKNVVGWEGDRGRGDIADLLGRFAKHDPDKARNLQSELHKLTGERIPFRIAPTRTNTGGPMADLADGEADTVKLPKSNPWGSAEHADRWEAGNMAKVLLGRTDYKDAVKHFAGEFKRDPDMAKPYTAAVFDEMAKSSPQQAVQFMGQMKAAGLVEETKAEPTPAPAPAPTPAPAPAPEPKPPAQPQPAPTTKPDDKPPVAPVAGPVEDKGPKVTPTSGPAPTDKPKDPADVNVGWQVPGGVKVRDEKTGEERTVHDLTKEPWPNPVMVDKTTGKPVLAPDGKPYHTGDGRTEELLDLSKKMASQDRSRMTPDELDQWRRDMAYMRVFLGGQTGGDTRGGESHTPQSSAPSSGSQPPRQKPSGRPEVASPRGQEGGMIDEIVRLWDKFFTDPKNAPQVTETPPLDPPPPPPPPPVPTGRPAPGKRRRTRYHSW